MCVCARVCVCVCVCIQTPTTHMSIYAHAHALGCAYCHTCVQVHYTRICIHTTHMHLPIDTHTDTSTDRQTHTHLHIRACMCIHSTRIYAHTCSHKGLIPYLPISRSLIADTRKLACFQVSFTLNSRVVRAALLLQRCSFVRYAMVSLRRTSCGNYSSLRAKLFAGKVLS